MAVRVLVVPLLVALAACGGSDSLSSLGDGGPGTGSSARTVLFDVSYVGTGIEREQGLGRLQECLEQRGAEVTVAGDGSPPVRQVSIAGETDDIRRFERCLLSVLNTRIARVPQQVEETDEGQRGRSLAERYDAPPTWPGDPWTRGGTEVSREELVLAAGAEHCGWEDSAFLAGEALVAPQDGHGALWVRDPQGVLEHDPRAKAEFRSPADLPADATWTGYAQDGVELWTAASDGGDHVYLVNRADRQDVERWVRSGGLCG